ncbi:FAD binding domain-containing protein [Xylariales sp. PMI_506]|nr:FAD binding domain-containing protein [Xylariales sp. PMI_506]
MSGDRFKIIVVGGGPVGLTAAHCLSQAGIDFLVLEHRDTVSPDVGASMVLYPHGLRVMAQLGLLEQLQKIGSEIRHITNWTAEGLTIKDNWAPEAFRTNHGTGSVAFHRAKLLETLYDSLEKSSKAKIITGKNVVDVKTSDTGVEVCCEDGSVYPGSMVLGTDGTQSKVRQIMRELAIKSSASNVNEEKPYQSEYRALWCNAPRPEFYETGHNVEVHSTDFSVQLVNGYERSWMFIYERLESPTRERASYTEEDAEALIARRADLPLGQKLTVKDLFASRLNGGITNLEEGIVKYWSWGRLVLAGDACHKMTPNQGLGFNNGIQDIVALVNELKKNLPLDHSENATLDGESLTAIFSRYQAIRMELLQKDLEFSKSLTRVSAWSNNANWFLDRYVLGRIPGLDAFLINKIISPLICKSLVLDFVEGNEVFKGKQPWEYALKSPAINWRV